MKIAFFCPRFPYPLTRGDNVSVFGMLRSFAREHEVTLISFRDGTEPPEALERLAACCARIETIRLPRARSWIQAWLALFSSEPSQVAYYRSPEMARLLRATIAAGGFDAVLAHTIRVGHYLFDIPHPCKILVCGDSANLAYAPSIPFEPWWKRPGLTWELRRLNRLAVISTRRFVESWVYSLEDQADLLRLGCERVLVVPYGVDRSLLELERAPAPEPRVVFIGNMGVAHNVDAVRFVASDVWPLVRRAVPAARFLIVGANPPAAVRELASVEGIEVTGPVADLRDVWRQAHVLLAPLRYSSGVQVKLLEAMAAGVPVVVTRRPAEAIGARHREHLLVADTARELAEAVSETLRDPAEGRARALRARELVRQDYVGDAPLRRLDHYRRAAPSAGSPGTRS